MDSPTVHPQKHPRKPIPQSSTNPPTMEHIDLIKTCCSDCCIHIIHIPHCSQPSALVCVPRIFPMSCVVGQTPELCGNRSRTFRSALATTQSSTAPGPRSKSAPPASQTSVRPAFGAGDGTSAVLAVLMRRVMRPKLDAMHGDDQCQVVFS